ncbi:unnamed protein product [Cuscuta epithymum]|uniref:Endonuclease/exonuclease/phosphatase domain-containing protein n=1 Tax=Cuscuta epithymum TaxID=186058 RepID=A0AAV0E6K4_9ASTE|nr:unnamed protein product [Cuscuta epithymum]
MNRNMNIATARSSPVSDASSLRLGVVSNMQGCATLHRPGCGDKNAKVARSSPGSGASSHCPRMMSNMHGHGGIRGGAKNIRWSARLRFGTWNVGSLTGRSSEVVEVMRRRNISIMCVQETKWVGEKAREINPGGFKLWYSGRDKTRNGVGIIVARDYVEDVVEVFRKNDRIMSIKLVMRGEIVSVISAYAPQVGLDASTTQQFWEDLEEVVRRVPRGEKLVIGGDLNVHVGSSRDGFESIHGGHGFGTRNEAGKNILDFASTYELAIMNTWFRKRDSHLVTYRSGANSTQIDYFLVRTTRRTSYTDCKVIPGESVVTQHRMLVLDFRGKNHRRQIKQQVEPKIKWWRLEGDLQQSFAHKMFGEDVWRIDNGTHVEDAWLSMELTINKVAKEVLGESKGCLPPKKDTSWWNDDVKQAIRNKRYCYKKLGTSRSDENIEAYKEARRQAKKAVKESQGKVNKELYEKLDSKEGEQDIYKLARLRDRRTQDIGKVKCVKDVDQRILMEDIEIKERWRSYFDTLFNGNKVQDIGDLTIPDCMVNRDFVRRIQPTEVKEALRKMGRKKAVGPDGIPIEAWRSLEKFGRERHRVVHKFLQQDLEKQQDANELEKEYSYSLI